MRAIIKTEKTTLQKDEKEKSLNNKFVELFMR
jgi:hypothetical protein